ncbi:MAG TPA: hypothetical protein PK037_10990 [Saprospiraceae bacterium]|nr:hypothetical protein [Saprospiraceae bacterium]
MNLFKSSNTLFALGIILLAVISRLIPHAYNFAPFGAIALFSGSVLSNRILAVLVPCLAAWFSGIILNNLVYQSIFTEFTWFDYNIFWQSLSYALTAMLGMTMLSTKPRFLKLALAAISASMIFFILTNFGYWTTGLFYTRDLAGLVTCYFNALPFYPASLAGDLIYSVAMFGIYYLVVRRRFQTSAVN